MAGLITPIEVRAEVIVSTTDRTRRLGDQSFKGNYDRENTLFGVDNILLGKTVAQERSFFFEVTFYTSEFAKPYEAFWQEPADSDVMILSSDGSAPVLVNQAVVLRASPMIKEIVTISSAPADVSSIDHHRHHAQCSSAIDLSNTPTNALSTLPEPKEDNNEQLLIGKRIQECPQPAGNRKTRRMMQKKAKANHHGLMMASASVSEEGAPKDIADGYASAPSSSSISSSSLLLSQRFSDVTSSEHNTLKPSPAVLHSSTHANTKEDPLSVVARSGKEIWVWPQDLPASSCETIMRWIYLGTVPSTPLKDFNTMYALLCRLSNRVLLQAYVTTQRRAIERHPSPWDLITAADYNLGPAKVLLRPVLVATIKKKWSSIL